MQVTKSLIPFKIKSFLLLFFKKRSPCLTLKGLSLTVNLYADLRLCVLSALHAAVPDVPAELAAKVEVTPARDAQHGDMATNAAMVVARFARCKPADLAARIVAGLADVPEVASAEVAGPGFVNLRLRPEVLRAQLPVMLRAGEAYGDSLVGQGVAVNVEYVSANPTGPMHIGHCRGAVVGDALANLLQKAGFAVTKEFYINDAGAQVIALAWAAYWRYLQAIGTILSEEAYAESVPGGLQYRGDYLVPVGVALAQVHGAALAGPDGVPAAPSVWLDVVRDTTMAMMLASICLRWVCGTMFSRPNARCWQVGRWIGPFRCCKIKG
jgi:arginyl-tRNA synthetase